MIFPILLLQCFSRDALFAVPTHHHHSLLKSTKRLYILSIVYIVFFETVVESFRATVNWWTVLGGPRFDCNFMVCIVGRLLHLSSNAQQHVLHQEGSFLLHRDCIQDYIRLISDTETIFFGLPGEIFFFFQPTVFFTVARSQVSQDLECDLQVVSIWDDIIHIFF